jgi:hypothetical protein
LLLVEIYTDNLGAVPKYNFTNVFTGQMSSLSEKDNISIV